MSWRSRAKQIPGVMALRVYQRRIALGLELARPRRYLLVASHMRSYSTLLGHIMASSDETAGYTEMRRSYRAEADLIALAMQVRASHGGRLPGGIVLDKILHGGNHIGDEILAMENVSVLISARHPHATVRSIVALGRTVAPDNWMAQPARAGQHFVNRMKQLGELVDRIEKPLVLAADSLVDDTDDTLTALGKSLGLSTPLSSTYETNQYTGKAEYGDTSAYISSGHIERDRRTYSEIEIAPEIDAQTLAAWHAFWAHVRNGRAQVIGHLPLS